MNQRRMNNGVLEILDKDDQVIMAIREVAENGGMTIAVAGKIRNDVAHDFEDELMAVVSVCPRLLIDMSKTEYIAGMALRSLLFVQQNIDNMNGEMRCKISSQIKPDFEEAGLMEILNIIEE